MEFYTVTIGHLITEDSYLNGEIGDIINEYSSQTIVYANNMKEAIKEAFQKELLHDINFNNIEDDEGNLYYGMLVDNENVEATKQEVKDWKQGKIKLYNDNIQISCFKMIPQYLINERKQ